MKKNYLLSCIPHALHRGKREERMQMASWRKTKNNESEFNVKSTLSLNLISCTAGKNLRVQFQQFSLTDAEQQASKTRWPVLIPDFMTDRNADISYYRAPWSPLLRPTFSTGPTVRTVRQPYFFCRLSFTVSREPWATAALACTVIHVMGTPLRPGFWIRTSDGLTCLF